MLEREILVDPKNEDVVLKRFLALGWGWKQTVKSTYRPTTLILTWPKSGTPLYPDLTDLN